MHATFRQLQIMLALAETGSITGAARHCHVTQPTASMQLKELSDAIGLPLYERVGQRLHLTQAGEAAAQTARAIAADWEALEQRVAALKGVSQGRLRIALASTAKYFIPRMLGRFCEEHPGVDVAMQVLNRDGVVQRLLANEDDLYILSIPPRGVPHDRQVLLSNPLVVIAAHDHPLVARRRVRLEQLLKEPFILRETGSGTRLATDEHFKALGFAPRVRLELGSNEAIKQSVAARMGLGLVSRHALAAVPASEGVAILAAERMPVPSSWYVLWPQGKRLSPIAENFLRQLLQQARRWEVHS